MPPSIAANSSPHRYNHDAARCSRANPAGSSISPVLCASSASGERAIARPYPCDTPASSASVPRAWLLYEGRFRTNHLHEWRPRARSRCVPPERRWRRYCFRLQARASGSASRSSPLVLVWLQAARWRSTSRRKVSPPAAWPRVGSRTSIEEVAVPSSNHELPPSARSRARRSCIAIALWALSPLALAGPAAAAGQATVTTTVEHLFSNPEHLDGCPGEPGVTEYATGTERLQVVELANGTVNGSLGRTLRITEVSDDPTVPPRQRQLTDAQ